MTTTNTPAFGDRQLDGLKLRPMWMSQMGSLIACARFLGSPSTPTWIYGGCGYAFALNIHPAICPSGPTAWPSEKTSALAAHVGLRGTWHHCSKDRPDFRTRQKEIFERTRQALDAGRPCFGWEMNVPEFYPIYGCDAEGHYLFRDFHGDGRLHYTKLGDTGIGHAAVCVVEAVQPGDDRTIVREALRFALTSAAGKHVHEGYSGGLAGYDTWIAALKNAELASKAGTAFGQAYNAQCWAECRRHAAAFLNEARTRLADARLTPLFTQAIVHYEQVRDHLDQVAKLFPFNPNDQPALSQRFAEADRRAQAAATLTKARDAERQGLAWLAQIARHLGADGVDAAFLGQTVQAAATAPAPGSVQRNGNKVWIEGVPDGAFGIQWDMALRAVQTLLAYRGIAADLDELLAHSGDAFNLCHASNWQGTAYLAIPTDPLANLAGAYGIAYQTTHAGPTWPFRQGKTPAHRREAVEAALALLRAELEAGRPVIGAGLEDHCGSMSIVVGHDPRGPALYHVGDRKGYRWTPLRGVAPGAPNDDFGVMDGRCRGTVVKGSVGGWLANPLYLFGPRQAAPAPAEPIAAALRRAVELHRAPKVHLRTWGGVDYYFGAEAYQQWAKALRELDYPADLKKPRPKDAYDWFEMGNLDTQVDQIVRGRRAAAAFCDRAAEVLPAAARPHLAAAAQAYRDQAALARETFAPFIPAFNGNDGPRAAWLSDKARCAAGADAVERMLERERAAIQAIEKALK